MSNSTVTEDSTSLGTETEDYSPTNTAEMVSEEPQVAERMDDVPSFDQPTTTSTKTSEEPVDDLEYSEDIEITEKDKQPDDDELVPDGEEDKVDEVAKKDDKTGDAAKKEQSSEADKKKAEDVKGEKPTVETTQEKKSRDYSKFDPADVNILRKLKNGVFDAVSPRLLARKQEVEGLQTKVKELESQIKTPVTVYDHPESYKLSPEYNEVVDTYNRASREMKFFELQAQRCMSGQSYYRGVSGWKDGRIVPAERIDKPDRNTIARDSVMFNSTISRGQQISSELLAREANIRGSYTNNLKSVVSTTQENYNGFVSGLPENIRPTEAEVKAVLDKAHPSLRTLPTANITASALVVIGKLVQTLKAVQEKSQAKARVDIDKDLAGPATTGKVASGKKTNGQSTVYDLQAITDEFE